MREANYCLPLEGTPSYPVLYGIARGLEDLFPVPDHPHFSDREADAGVPGDADGDDIDKGMRRVD